MRHGLDVRADHPSFDDTVLYGHCGCRMFTAATAQRHSGFVANLPIEWQEGA